MTQATLECADAADFCEPLCTSLLTRFRFASVRLSKVASGYAVPAPPVQSWWHCLPLITT